MEPREILLRAVEEIQNRGWCQGRLKAVMRYITDPPDMPLGAVCLTGAVRQASFDAVYADPRLPNFSPYNTALLMVCGVIGTKQIVSWNDQPGRTKEEVIAALRTAAEKF
jgi:hypothetical protein